MKVNLYKYNFLSTHFSLNKTKKFYIFPLFHPSNKHKREKLKSFLFSHYFIPSQFSIIFFFIFLAKQIQNPNFQKKKKAPINLRLPNCI